MEIREYLKDNRMIMDGAMGTYYSRISNTDNIPSELANLTDPNIILRIHSEYIKAGARLLRTNSFSVSQTILSLSEKEQWEMVQASFRIAKQAVDECGINPVFIAGDIGPLPETAEQTDEDVLNEYKNQCDAFLEAGAKIILFETFPDIKYIRQLAGYIKKDSPYAEPNLFLMVHFCMNKEGYTSSGIHGNRLLKEAGEIEEIDSIGLNCGIGSGHMLNFLERESFPKHKFFAAVPNSNYPELIQNRLVFANNVNYFADTMKKIAELKVPILGGCCGTTPDYIKKMTERINQVEWEPVHFSLMGGGIEELAARKKEHNAFYEKLMAGEKVIAVELDPPYNSDFNGFLQCARDLDPHLVDMITLADSPMGRSRVDSLLIGAMLAKEVSIPVMPHICCRDKNRIALRSAVLGAHMNGMRNFLIVTGDPVPKEERSLTTGVFDYNSIRLMEMVNAMKTEHFSETPVYYGGALNYGNGRLDKIIERMNEKISAGASYFLTQPVFSREDMDRIRLIKEQTDTKILCGIMPLVSYRNANFIKNEFTGIHVSDEIVERYHPDMTKEEGEAAGASIAREIMKNMEQYVDGFYFMLPFNRVSLMGKILEE